jgi:hypothetical protein
MAPNSPLAIPRVLQQEENTFSKTETIGTNIANYIIIVKMDKT